MMTTLEAPVAKQAVSRSRRGELLLITLAVLTIGSVASHLVTRVLKLRTEAVSELTFGAGNLPARATAAGSSLAFFGIDWEKVSGALGTRVRAWTIPCGSVLENELFQSDASPAACTVLGISAHDLNENYVSDFRADII